MVGSLSQLQEKLSEKKKKMYHVFVDQEKAFGRVPRKAIEWALRRQKRARIARDCCDDSSCMQNRDQG